MGKQKKNKKMANTILRTKKLLIVSLMIINKTYELKFLKNAYNKTKEHVKNALGLNKKKVEQKKEVPKLEEKPEEKLEDPPVENNNDEPPQNEPERLNIIL